MSASGRSVSQMKSDARFTHDPQSGATIGALVDGNTILLSGCFTNFVEYDQFVKNKGRDIVVGRINMALNNPDRFDKKTARGEETFVRARTLREGENAAQVAMAAKEAMKSERYQEAAGSFDERPYGERSGRLDQWYAIADDFMS